MVCARAQPRTCTEATARTCTTAAGILKALQLLRQDLQSYCAGLSRGVLACDCQDAVVGKGPRRHRLIRGLGDVCCHTADSDGAPVPTARIAR